MTIPKSIPSGPRLRGCLLFTLALAVGCKKGDDTPPAGDATPASDPEAPAVAAEKADPAPKTDATKGADAGVEKGGIAALTKGLIDEAKAAPPDPLTVVPASAVLVAQVQWLPFKLVPGWEDARAAIVRELGDGERTLESFRECQLDLEQMQSVTFAMMEGEHGLAVVNGPGFGVAKNHECAIDKLRAIGKADEYELADHEGDKRIVLDKGDSYGYFLGDDTVLIVDKEIEAEVAALRKGEGASVAKGELQATIARVDTAKHAWFAGRAVDFMKKGLDSSGIGEIHELWGTAHFEGDLALHFGTRLSDAAAATSARDTTQKQFDEMKAMLPMFGVPAGVLAKVTFAAKDDRFTVDVSMTEAEMSSIHGAIKSRM